MKKYGDADPSSAVRIGKLGLNFKKDDTQKFWNKALWADEDNAVPK